MSRGISLCGHYFTDPNDGNVHKRASEVVSKFQDDLTYNEYEIVVLLWQVWVYGGEREGFMRERRKNEFGRKKECIDNCNCNNWLNMSKFIVIVLWACYFLL